MTIEKAYVIECCDAWLRTENLPTYTEMTNLLVELGQWASGEDLRKIKEIISRFDA